MARPATITRAIAILDAEIERMLARYEAEGRLPVLLTLYRRPNSINMQINSRTSWVAAARIGRMPMLNGRLPTIAAIVDPDAAPDAAGRYLLRLLRSRKHRDDTATFAYLLTHLPRGQVVALARKRREQSEARARLWAAWQREAETVWREHPAWRKARVAGIVRRRLKLTEDERSITRRLRRP